MKSYIKYIVESLFDDIDITTDDILASKILSNMIKKELQLLNIFLDDYFISKLERITLTEGENYFINDDLSISLDFKNKDIIIKDKFPKKLIIKSIKCLQLTLDGFNNLYNMPQDIIAYNGVIIYNYTNKKLLFNNNFKIRHNINNTTFYKSNNTITIRNSPKLISLGNISKYINIFGLYIQDCENLSDLSKLPINILSLILNNCGIKDLSTLKNNVKIKNLKILYCNLLQSLTGLIKKLNILHVTNCNSLISLDIPDVTIYNFKLADNNKLKSLKNGPKLIINSYYVFLSNLKTIQANNTTIANGGSFIIEGLWSKNRNDLPKGNYLFN